MFKKIVLGLAAFAMACGAGFAVQAQEKPLTEKDVERIVARYIEENGDLINSSISNYLQRKQMQDAASAISMHTPTLGPDKAKVTVIEFSDFECPFCSRVQPTLDELMRRYDTRVQFAFKHLPLEQLHPTAIQAAYAAQAAHRQGKFWEFRKALFERQEFSGEQLWLDVAKELKLDMDKFNKDRKSDAIAKEVAVDLADAERLGARGTPYFLINGQPLSGAQPLEVFVSVVENELNKAEGSRGQ